MRRLLAVGIASVALLAVTRAVAEDIESGNITAADGVKIHYLEKGQGTPVVLLHGYTGSAEGNWVANGIADALAKTNRVIAIDARGHGESGKPHDAESYGPWMWQDVIRVMDELGIEKAHVHGYSMGGGLVTALLFHYPNRLITASYGGSGVPEVEQKWIDQVPEDAEGPDPQEAEASATLRSRPNDPEALAAVRESFGQSQRAAELIDLTSVDIPVLAIVGEYDRPNVRTHRMQRELKDFRRVILPGKSHLTAIMAGYMPQTYVDELTAFITANNPDT